MVEALMSGHAQEGVMEFFGGIALFVIIAVVFVALCYVASLVMPHLIRAWQWAMSAPDDWCACDRRAAMLAGHGFPTPGIMVIDGENICAGCGRRIRAGEPL
jgi:hypothetical protein